MLALLTRAACCCPSRPHRHPQELSPASQTARFEDLQVYRVGGGPRAPSSALPIGEKHRQGQLDCLVD